MCYVLIALANKQLEGNSFGQKMKYLLIRSNSFLLSYLVISIFLLQLYKNWKMNNMQIWLNPP